MHPCLHQIWDKVVANRSDNSYKVNITVALGKFYDAHCHCRSLQINHYNIIIVGVDKIVSIISRIMSITEKKQAPITIICFIWRILGHTSIATHSKLLIIIVYLYFDMYKSCIPNTSIASEIGTWVWNTILSWSTYIWLCICILLAYDSETVY